MSARVCRRHATDRGIRARIRAHSDANDERCRRSSQHAPDGPRCCSGSELQQGGRVVAGRSSPGTKRTRDQEQGQNDSRPAAREKRASRHRGASTPECGGSARQRHRPTQHHRRDQVVAKALIRVSPRRVIVFVALQKGRCRTPGDRDVAKARASRSALVRRMQSSGGRLGRASGAPSRRDRFTRERPRDACGRRDRPTVGLFGVGGETAIACDDQRVNEALPLGLRAAGDGGVTDVRQP